MNYWQILEQARTALTAGSFRDAEDLLAAADAERCAVAAAHVPEARPALFARRLAYGGLRRQELPRPVPGGGSA